MGRAAFIALLAAAAVALVACGSGTDSGGSPADISTTSGVIPPQGTTGAQGGATGATGATGTKRAARTRTGKSRRRSNKASGSAAPTAPTDQGRPAPAFSPTRAQLKEVGRQQAKQARVLCQASTLQGLAQQYGIKQPDVDKVAKAFAAGYLVAVRDAVAAGCKKGLLEVP